MFTALNSVTRLANFLPFKLVTPSINLKSLAKKLAAEGKKESNQILAIPQSLADIIYGEAINLVEQAWPHRDIIAGLECELQQNYDACRIIIDEKISSGKWKFLHDSNGRLKRKQYSEEIHKAFPQTQSSYIKNALAETGLLPEKLANGIWFKYWKERLQAACFICCGAFSGMRVSELFELYPNSFCTYEINGQRFQALSAATHKLAKGKKREEWLCSPIVEKAIQLAFALSANLRKQMLLVAENTPNSVSSDFLQERAECLWLSQRRRSSIPIVIDSGHWNLRLKTFAKAVGALVDENSLAECRKLNPAYRSAIELKVKVGSPWPLSTHQFRRTFACFAVRNHLGHPIALKQQFKHLYLRMSEWYSNGAIESRLQDIRVDSEITKLLDQASAEYAVSTYNNWFNGNETLSGSFGKAILAMRQDMPIIYSSWDNLYRLVKEKRLSLHGTLHSYCKNSYDCDMEGVVNPALCVDCKSGGSVIDSEKASWWQKRHTALTGYLQENQNVSPGEYSHCITQIRAAEQVMRDHSIKHETYHHPIEIISI